MRTAFTLLAIVQAVCGASPPTIFYAPHTHGDVGWQSTFASLARQNVSNIINGVLQQFQADTEHAKRFTWEEIAWFRRWWAGANSSQQALMRSATASGQLGFYDAGITQSDNACPDLDSMIENLQSGHQWVATALGPAALPRVGASLDPFGLSSSNGVLLSKAGMDSWIFWRMPSRDHDSLAANGDLEFVWRPSSSLGNDVNLTVHGTFLSYCAPHDYEFGQPGVPIPVGNATLTAELGQSFVDMMLQRSSAYGNSSDLLFLAGCDYAWQHTQLRYASSDAMLDYISSNSSLGATVRYSTMAEYFDSLSPERLASLAVKHDGGDFFVYDSPIRSSDYQGWWSGYFVSRASLKQAERRTTSLAQAAWAASMLQTGTGAPVEALWDASAAAAVLTHHDAITGTGCESSEGCTGRQEMGGSHDVVGDYQNILSATDTAVNGLLAAALFAGEPTATADVMGLGALLEAGTVARIRVYNPTAQNRTEAYTVPIPVCAVQVTSTDPASSIIAEVHAHTLVAGVHPYAFELVLHVEDLGPYATREYVVDPAPSLTDCTAAQAANPAGGSPAHGRTVWDSRRDGVRAEGAAMSPGSRSVEANGADLLPPFNDSITLENAWMRVDINMFEGIKTITDKVSGRTMPVSHSIGCRPDFGDAYIMNQTNWDEPAAPCANSAAVLAVSVNMGAVLQEVRFLLSRTHSFFYRLHVGPAADASEALGGSLGVWVRSGVVEANTATISTFTVPIINNVLPAASAADAGPAGASDTPVLYTTDNGYESIARVWNKTSPMNTNANSFPASTDLFLRGSWAASLPSSSFSSSQPEEHTPSPGHARGEQGKASSPFQVPWFDGSQAQMSVSVDRAHAVSTGPSFSRIELVHFRRTLTQAVNPSIILDDVARMVTRTRISISDAATSNRRRHQASFSMRYPLTAAFAPAAAASPLPVERTGTRTDAALPPHVRVQSMRPLSSDGKRVLVRVISSYAANEDPTLPSEVPVDLAALVEAASAGAIKAQSCTETLLTGFVPLADKPAWIAASKSHDMSWQPTWPAETCSVSISPFDIRTFVVQA